MKKPHYYMLIFLFSNVFNVSAAKIHVFGDSHACYCFTNEYPGVPKDEISYYFYECKSEKKKIEFNIHWLGPKTMFSIGREGLNQFNIKEFGILENEIAVFVFGEIDVRCHIGKQRDTKNRNLTEIIESLIASFMETIKNNKNQFSNLRCVIMSVIPPTNNIYNPDYPYYGTIEDRAAITKELNKKIKEYCEIYSFDFLDIYPFYANDDGTLANEHSDKSVHINPIENNHIKQNLIGYLDQKFSTL